jgi:hypothetical protein
MRGPDAGPARLLKKRDFENARTSQVLVLVNGCRNPLKSSDRATKREMTLSER